MKAARVEAYERRAAVDPSDLSAHALPIPGADRRLCDFDVPLLDGDHVTDEAGTGFVHTAPGHGRRRL